MRKIYTILFAVILTVTFFLPRQASAQAPEKMSYQAVVRDASDNLVTSTSIGMQISILQGSTDGTPVYVETQITTSNANGLVSIEIGSTNATVVSGDFSTIDWANGIYFIKTETDPAGGTSYTITGTSQLLSVPYALHAKTAESISGGITETDPIFVASPANGINGTDIINWNNKLTTEVDGSITNEIQALSISNDTIYLSNGGFVKLPTTSAAVLLPPTVTVQAVTDLDITTATMNGTVNANGLSTTVVFEYGLTTAYGSTSTATQNPTTGTANTPVSKGISGLQGNTTYHYRINTTNAVDISYSNDITFTTNWPNLPTVTTSNYSDIKGNSANAGGEVTNNGGSSITAQGLCWSTDINPTIANSVTTSFTDVMTGLSPNTTYYIRAYATNIAGTGYGNQISFNSGKLIGSIYGGGLVFYNDGLGNGLVCAETEQSTVAEWGCYGTTIDVTSSAINTGAANTNAIVASCTTEGIAAKLCFDLSLNSYSDWYLPSIDELYLMYVNLHTQSLGGFTSGAYYWSSTEYNLFEAHTQSFINVGFCTGNKGAHNYYTRAVRAF